MQDELRITFFVIGIVFIIGILLHGAWTIRKNKRQSKPNNFQSGRAYEPRIDSRHQDEPTIADDDDIYDDVGVGQARVVSGNTENGFSATTDPTTTGSNNKPNYQDDDAVLVDTPIIDEDTDLPKCVEPVRTVIVDELTDDQVFNDDALQDDIVQEHDATGQVDKVSSSPVYSGVVTQPKPEFTKAIKASDYSDAEAVIPEPPEFLLKKTDSTSNPNESADPRGESPQTSNEGAQPSLEKPAPDFSLNVQEGPATPKPVEDLKAETKLESKTAPLGVEKELSFAEQAKRFVTRRKKTVAEKIRKEPKANSSGKDSVDQMRIDFESESASDVPELSATKADADNSRRSEAAKNDKTQSSAPQSDVLVLNVRANAENPISGAALLPMLLTLGFKFGEHDIFHRHVNTNGKGPILFSLTNMFKPGVFDIDNIENFSTLGVSLFMMLPIEGEAQQVFNMMHNAARKISDEFDCKILDGNKVLISKQSLQQYSERIREFERSRFSR